MKTAFCGASLCVSGVCVFLSAVDSCMTHTIPVHATADIYTYCTVQSPQHHLLDCSELCILYKVQLIVEALIRTVVYPERV
jgi:hypothetical protein